MTAALEPVEGRTAIPRSSALALRVLIGIAVVSPWAFGSVQPWAMATIAGIALLVVLEVSAHAAMTEGMVLPGLALWPLAGFAALGLLQLVPLPPVLQRLIAPGSYAVWHPSNAAAAAVLGDGWRPLSVFPTATVGWLDLAGGLALLAVLAAPAASVPATASRACGWIAAAGAAVSIFGVVAHVMAGNLLYGTIAVPTIAPFGPFVSKNHFAGYVVMAALLAAGFALGLGDRERSGPSALDWVQSPRAGRMLAAYAAVFAMALGVLVSLSRGGVVSLLAGLATLAALRWEFRRRRPHRVLALAAPVVVAAMTMGLLIAVLPNEAHERIWSLTGATAEQSGSFRLQTWGDCLRAAWASPALGQGLGAFADALARFKTGWGQFRTEHAENDYLELVVEGGVVAAVLLVALGSSTFGAGLGRLRAARGRLLRGVAAGGLAALVATAVHSAVDFNLHIPSNAALLASIVAVTMGAVSPRPPSRSRALVVAAASAVLLGLLGDTLFAGFGAGPAGEVEMFRAAAAGSDRAYRLRLARSEIALRHSIMRRPASAEAWLSLAWVVAARGDRDAAGGLLDHARQLDPQWPELAAEVRRLRLQGPSRR